MRPLSKTEAEEFLRGSPSVVTPPLALAQRPAAPHIPVSPPRVGAAAAKAAAVPAAAQPQAEPAAAAPSAAAPAGAAAQNGKAPSGPPSRVLRLANMVRACPICMASSLGALPAGRYPVLSCQPLWAPPQPAWLGLLFPVSDINRSPTSEITLDSVYLSLDDMALQVTREELLEEDEYDDILKEVEEELEAKYGKLAAIVMPQPSKKGLANDPAGVGLVFVKFEDLPRAVRLTLPLSQNSNRLPTVLHSLS